VRPDGSMACRRAGFNGRCRPDSSPHRRFFPDGRSALGTSWQTFTDRVMGGVSEARPRSRRSTASAASASAGGYRSKTRAVSSRRPCLWPKGAAHSMGAPSRASASGPEGTGTGTTFTFARTTRAFPGSTMRPGSMRVRTGQASISPFPPSSRKTCALCSTQENLRRLAIVAAKQAFAADVAVARIELYN
jgi:hypothetical protein